MTLILMRHGEANSVTVDPNKGLSEKGKQQVESVAAKLAKHATDSFEIWHSPKERAYQTAKLVGQHLGLKEQALILKEELSPSTSAEEIYHNLQTERPHAIVVTHLPLVDQLLSLLLFGQPGHCQVDFGCSTCVVLEFKEDRWHLEKMYRP